MNHEKSRAIKMKRIMAIEKNRSLFIKAEQSNIIALINTII